MLCRILVFIWSLGGVIAGYVGLPQVTPPGVQGLSALTHIRDPRLLEAREPHVAVAGMNISG